MPARLILGIETSCDDTAMALVKTDCGSLVAQNSYNQTAHHYPVYGGIFPALAQELHEEKIEEVFDGLMEASNSFKTNISHIAVTNRPGLPYSLSAGLKFAKELSKKSNLPLLPIHHMRAHALIARMARFDKRRSVNPGFPYLTLLLSGGHSLICLVRSARDFSVIGHNVGWATAGNTLDRCVKYLDLYVKDSGGDSSKCGGQIAESLARSFYRKSSDNRIAERFLCDAKDRHCLQLTCNFDFFAFYKWFTQLDLKSFGSREAGGGKDSIGEAFAGLQQSLMQYVWRKLLRAIYYCVEVLKLSDFKNIVFSGGCAASSYFCDYLKLKLSAMNMNLIVPEKSLCRDNGVMIAWNAYELLRAPDEQTDNDEIIDPKNIEDLEALRYYPKSIMGSDVIDEVNCSKINSKMLREFQKKCETNS